MNSPQASHGGSALAPGLVHDVLGVFHLQDLERMLQEDPRLAAMWQKEPCKSNHLKMGALATKSELGLRHNLLPLSKFQRNCA